MRLTPIAQAVGVTVPGSTVEPCRHPELMARVHFDPVAARGLDAAEVRRRWPRLCAPCPQCRADVIAYASFQHYIAGDW